MASEPGVPMVQLDLLTIGALDLMCKQFKEMFDSVKFRHANKLQLQKRVLPKQRNALLEQRSE